MTTAQGGGASRAERIAAEGLLDPPREEDEAVEERLALLAYEASVKPDSPFFGQRERRRAFSFAASTTVTP